MQSTMPKQFMTICGLPMLMHTLLIFAPMVKKTFLTLPSEFHVLWENLVQQYSFNMNLTIIQGGKTRFDSVKNALCQLPDDGLVAIHDAVRPCVTKTLIQKCFEHAEQNGSAIPCVPVVDSLRKKTNKGSQIVDRDLFLSVQTPQVFFCKEIKKAYSQNYSPAFTDDASVMETWGKDVSCLKGDPNNIKVTIQKDLFLAEYLLQTQR